MSSNINFGGKKLMKWREPNIYVRKEFSVRPLIRLLLVFAVLFGLAFAIKSKSHPKDFPFTLVLIILLVFFISFIRIWYLPGYIILLKKLCVQRRAGYLSRGSNYDKIESATVSHRNHNGHKFLPSNSN